jgi:DNA-directed RNA polymerase subunit RPC12/RpoP
MRTVHDGEDICKFCKGKVPVRDLKYHSGYKEFVCGKCYLLKEKKETKADQIMHGRRADYSCKYCNSNFTKPFKTGLIRCPFCNSDQVHLILDKGKNLVREIDDVLFEDSKGL